jgi:hypothetical protein
VEDELFFAVLSEKKNIPIVRVGNEAALRDEDEPVLNKSGNLMGAYLVGSRSIAGRSCSPVFMECAVRQTRSSRNMFLHHQDKRIDVQARGLCIGILTGKMRQMQ